MTPNLQQFEMSLYPALTKLVEENYFQENQPAQIEVGFKLLEYMFFNICFLKLKDPKYYTLIKMRIPQIIIDELKICDKQHLGMCLGGISQNENYQILNQIEKQIQKIIKSKQKSKMISIIHSESSHSKTFDNSKSSFQGYDIQGFKNKHSQILNNISQSSIKKRENKNDDSSFSIIFQLNQSSSQRSAPPVDVQAYLKEIVHYKNSQLSFVNQILNLKLEWEQQQQGNNFNAKGKIIVSDLYTKVGDVEIIGQGTAKRKQAAKEQVSTKILRRLYQRYPNIFNKIIKQKKKKGINF